MQQALRQSKLSFRVKQYATTKAKAHFKEKLKYEEEKYLKQ
jgi:hypothetical protein